MPRSAEASFLEPFHRPPVDPLHQLIYADWLEEHGDPRSQVLRLQLVLRFTSPDSVERFAREDAYSIARKDVDEQWLEIIDPKPFRKSEWVQQPCRCIRGPRPKGQPPFVPKLHSEWQDTQSPGWKKLERLIDEVAKEGHSEFKPLNEMTNEERCDIITLPPTIAKLTKVRLFSLYQSNLIRIPNEIAQMKALNEFSCYSSYRIHWFPYELRQSPCLRDSLVSTRALFGNFKNRATFPKLEPILSGVPVEVVDAMKTIPEWNPFPTRPCSVCERMFEDRQQHRVWISKRIGTDIVPLLVNACSQQCIDDLPKPAKNYVSHPHPGGAEIIQPKVGF